MDTKEKIDSEEYISEAEIFIQEFLLEEGIEFEYNKKIDALNEDTKAYRLADFYLPRYELYVEFFGQWNTSEAHKVRYREKKNIYDKNNIACIYFYPENLGIIEYLFYYRAMKELKDRGKKKQLFRLRYDIICSESKVALILLALCLGLIIGSIKDYNNDPKGNSFMIFLYLLFILPLLGSLYWKYRKLVTKKFHKEYNQYV